MPPIFFNWENSLLVSNELCGADVCMNIMEYESPLVEARTCGVRQQSSRKVAYRFTDEFHSLCFDKRDILLAEIRACETLLKCCSEDADRSLVEKEIAELKLSLDLMP